jgi:4-alpha-glucanotransferase
MPLESATAVETVQVDGRRYTVRKLPLPASVPLGYHRLEVEHAGTRLTSLVIAAPPRAHDAASKSWGIFLPLHALHTADSWGCGDFSDLKRMTGWAAARGASLMGTLPMLAAFLETPLEISPYMPVSRMFWNELYVDPRRAPEFQHATGAARLTQGDSWQRRMEKLRGTELVDYAALMALKRPVLEAMALWFEHARPPRYARFAEYIESNSSLRDYAAFRAVTEKRKTPWRQWPARLRRGELRPSDFNTDNALYHMYAQWLADEQIREASGKGRRGAAALYLDFPLGVHPDGYDVWRHREVFAEGAEAGAPPDSLFTGGQKWGVPPLHPEALRQTGYEYLIACLRHQFLHAGWMRLDHVMGLHRLFWVPSGGTAKDGVYVRYFPDELYAIICLESHCAKTVIVGENLGTVPPEVTREMTSRRVKPMYVLQYEVQPSAKRPLGSPPPDAVASLNTHDMPPFAAFSKGNDIKDLAELGLFDAKEARERLRVRRKVCRALETFFLGERLGGKATAVPGRLLTKALEWLAAGDAKVLLINLEDLWLETGQQNVPGTRLERPNWQRKARLPFEQFTRDQQINSLLREIAKRRRR